MVHLARDPNVTNKIAVVGLFYKIGHHNDFLSKVQILSHKKIFNYLFHLFTQPVALGTQGLKRKLQNKGSLLISVIRIIVNKLWEMLSNAFKALVNNSFK